MKHAPVMIEYQQSGTRHRVTFDQIDGDWERREEVYRRGQWRDVGVEPVADVMVTSPAVEADAL